MFFLNSNKFNFAYSSFKRIKIPASYLWQDRFCEDAVVLIFLLNHWWVVNSLQGTGSIFLQLKEEKQVRQPFRILIWLLESIITLSSTSLPVGPHLSHHLCCSVFRARLSLACVLPSCQLHLSRFTSTNSCQRVHLNTTQPHSQPKEVGGSYRQTWSRLMLRMKQLVRLSTCFHIFLKCTPWPAAATKAKQWKPGSLAKPRPFPLNNRYYSCPSFQSTASILPSLMVQSVATFSHFPLNNCSLIVHRHKSSSELIGFLSHDNYWYCLFIYFHIKGLADFLSTWQPIMVSAVS